MFCSEMVQQNLYVVLTTVYLAMARDLMVPQGAMNAFVDMVHTLLLLTIF